MPAMLLPSQQNCYKTQEIEFRGKANFSLDYFT